MNTIIEIKTVDDILSVLLEAKQSTDKKHRSVLQLRLKNLAGNNFRKHEIELSFVDAMHGKYPVESCAEYIYLQTPNALIKLDELVDSFNKKYPVGSEVNWIPGKGVEPRIVKVKSPAFIHYGQAVVRYERVNVLCSILPQFIQD